MGLSITSKSSIFAFFSVIIQGDCVLRQFEPKLFQILLLPSVGMSQVTKLTSLSPCICPGYEATYECVVTGGVTTTWQGTALHNCAGGNIILRHSQFSLESELFINKTCGAAGLVIGRAISVFNDTYVSQITLHNVSQHLINRMIECNSGQMAVASRQVSLAGKKGISSIE